MTEPHKRNTSVNSSDQRETGLTLTMMIRSKCLEAENKRERHLLITHFHKGPRHKQNTQRRDMRDNVLWSKCDQSVRALPSINNKKG